MGLGEIRSSGLHSPHNIKPKLLSADLFCSYDSAKRGLEAALWPFGLIRHKHQYSDRASPEHRGGPCSAISEPEKGPTEPKTLFAYLCLVCPDGFRGSAFWCDLFTIYLTRTSRAQLMTYATFHKIMSSCQSIRAHAVCKIALLLLPPCTGKIVLGRKSKSLASYICSHMSDKSHPKGSFFVQHRRSIASTQRKKTAGSQNPVCVCVCVPVRTSFI